MIWLSLNIKGLGSTLKKRCVSRMVEMFRVDIILVQETMLLEEVTLRNFSRVPPNSDCIENEIKHIEKYSREHDNTMKTQLILMNKIT